VAPRSSAMVGNRGEIILNPNIAATMEKYRENNVRFSIILPIFFSSEDIKFLYINLSAKLALHLKYYFLLIKGADI
jgi:hypothetical protein